VVNKGVRTTGLDPRAEVPKVVRKPNVARETYHMARDLVSDSVVSVAKHARPL